MNKAFSLVEVAIVLVVLGLLVGTVMVGASMVEGARLRRVGVEYERYTTAIATFGTQYNALPGDMPNAIRYWGRAAGADVIGTDAACRDATTPATDATTCNGNGDSSIALTAATTYETYRAWQHLANAGMIEGKFSGVTAGAANNFSLQLGVNTPRSGYNTNTGFTLRAYPVVMDTSNLEYFPGAYGNLFWFGAAIDGAALTNSAALSGEDAWNIDIKLDDGMPQYGIILSPRNTSCVTATDPENAAYTVTNNARGCALMMRTAL